MYLREANIQDIDFLKELVYYSEKSLGFDENYMDMFKDKYNVNKDFLEKSYSYCMIDNNGDVAGFFGLLNKEGNYELEFFYINSIFIGMGYGKIMFKYLVDKCKELNIKKFYLVTSPESMDFYTKLGAIKIGETISILNNNRIIPRLEYIID